MELVNPKVIEVEDVERYLQYWVDNGYLLHGSNELCGTLKPSAGFCLTGLEENLQIAVYATISPVIAIFNAIRNRRLGYARYELINGNPYLEASEKMIEAFGEGYVYVLDKCKFRKSQIEEGQFTSSEEVRPICIFKVSKHDLNYPISSINPTQHLDI